MLKEREEQMRQPSRKNTIGALVCAAFVLGIAMTAQATCWEQPESPTKGFTLVSFEVVELVDPDAVPLTDASEAGWKTDFEQPTTEVYNWTGGILEANTAGPLQMVATQTRSSQ